MSVAMKQSARLRVLLYALAAVFLLAVVLFAIYNGSMPEKYLLRPGDISPYDIVAPRSIRDHVETERRAARAVSEVGDVALRSEEISSAVMERVSLFFSLIGQERDNPPLITPAPSPTPQPTAQPTPATQETETTLPVLPTEPLLPKVDTAVLADRIS